MSLIKPVNSTSTADASINCSATGILQNSKEWECSKGENCFSFDQHPLQHRAFKGRQRAPCPMACTAACVQNELGTPALPDTLSFLDHIVHLLWLHFFLTENSLAGQAGCESSSGAEMRRLGASSSAGSSPCSLGLMGAELHFLFAAGKLQGTGIFRMFFINQQDSVKEIPDSAVSFSSVCKQLCNFLNVH